LTVVGPNTITTEKACCRFKPGAGNFISGGYLQETRVAQQVVGLAKVGGLLVQFRFAYQRYVG